MRYLINSWKPLPEYPQVPEKNPLPLLLTFPLKIQKVQAPPFFANIGNFLVTFRPLQKVGGKGMTLCLVIE